MMIAGFCGPASAQDLPMVQFEAEPLFSEANLAPGSFVSRWVKVNNTTTEAHRVIARAAGVINSSQPKLSDAMELVIRQGDAVLYDNTFSNFFTLPEVVLPEVAAGGQATFDFAVTFKPESGNEYQGSAMNFDLEVGFEDVGVVADNGTIAISGSFGGQAGSQGGSTVVGPKDLIVSDESATAASSSQAGQVLIKWNTNIPATSQVIYGLASGGPYILDLTKTNFGYPVMPQEDKTKVTVHAVLLTGIVPGLLYDYRVVSRASPPTIGYEHTFMIAVATAATVGTSLIARNAGTSPAAVTALAQVGQETGGAQAGLQEVLMTENGAAVPLSTAGQSALFDIVAGPVGPPKQSIIPFLIFSVIAEILLILLIIFAVRRIRAYLVKRKNKKTPVENLIGGKQSKQ